MKLIAPSLLAADFGNLDRDVEMLNNSECDWIHLDVMDGVFVPNISFGFPVIKYIAKKAAKPLDAHLMIVNPDNYVEACSKLGVEYLSVHYEACTHLHRTIQNIHSHGMKAGVVLNPATSETLLEDILPDLDFVLLMSVNPGFGGQKFIPQTIQKARRLRAMIERLNPKCLIEMDGGINADNINELEAAGVDVFVAGNAVFSAEDPAGMISRMKR